jgi:signal transduction histidine kinase/DNA-binding LacI/PurR family transcriptional regulator
MKKTAKANARRTIGVFTAQVGRIWGQDFMSGIARSAEAYDLNLVIFVGGQPSALITPGEFTASYGLYDLVKPDRIDGLIMAADIAHGVKPKDLKAFYEQYASLPVVVNAIEIEDATNLLSDNIGGMQAVVRHLIEVHGYKKLAFVRGIKDQVDSDQRFHAYREELKAHGIKFDSKFVVDGDFSVQAGRNAIRVLFDERKLKPEVIVAANDRMAFGAMEALQQRGIRVPADVAVTGFDDVREAQSLGVPLTTVHQSFYDMGTRAVETLVELMDGQSPQPQVKIPTELVVRWSCGCLPESVIQASVSEQEVARTGHLENRRDAAIRALMDAGKISASAPTAEKFRQVCKKVWDTFLKSLDDDTTSETFLRAIQELVAILQEVNEEATSWHNIISTLRRHALAGIKEQKTTLRAENLFQQARMLVGELSQRAQAFHRLQLEQQEEILQGFSFSMAPAMSLAEVGAAVQQHFPRLGIQYFYMLLYHDSARPQPVALPPSKSYHLLMKYDEAGLQMPREREVMPTGRLIPELMPKDRRYTAAVMPLSLASNRFGFVWMEMGPDDWEVYARVRNLISSALLRAMLGEQREQAQKEIERLLEESKQRAGELAIAKDIAEQTAAELARLYGTEQSRRQQAEALSKSSRQLSTLLKVEEVPQQVLEQLTQILSYGRGALLLEEPGGTTHIMAHLGFPDLPEVDSLQIEINEDGVYSKIAQTGEALLIDDVSQDAGWKQVEWLPLHHSWMGVPLFSKNKVIGMLSLTREEVGAFSQDDLLLATTFGMQAAIALENARLYDELNKFNELMERMVAQRVEELNIAYSQLEKLDKNKTSFIQVAAHELRTPLTVMKGYLTMLRGVPAIQEQEMLLQAVDGVIKGTDRLHQIVNSMLDVVKLDAQTLQPHFEKIAIAPILTQIQNDYREDLQTRNMTLTLDENVRAAPYVMADSQLLQKALDNVIVNAIKFTPNGGSVMVEALQVADERLGDCVEITVRDTGIGIDPANHKIIFEKLYQLGKVELHSSGRTTFKGGGPGLGLAIASGIIKAHNGRIWVESPGYDESTLPGSTFFIRLPVGNHA